MPLQYSQKRKARVLQNKMFPAQKEAPCAHRGEKEQ